MGGASEGLKMSNPVDIIVCSFFNKYNLFSFKKGYLLHEMWRWILCHKWDHEINGDDSRWLYGEPADGRKGTFERQLRAPIATI